jgi:hypothetical protein
MMGRRKRKEGCYVIEGRMAETEVVGRMGFVLGEMRSLIQSSNSDSSIWHRVWGKGIFMAFSLLLYLTDSHRLC